MKTQQLLGELAEHVERIFADLDGLATQWAAAVAAAREAERPPSRDDLVPLRHLIFDLLVRHRGLVAGSGIITAPDLLADAPRWLEWWWTKASGSPEELRVNLDPAAPDFYDYTRADWYTAPQSSRQRCAVGPYVDYACTNDYAITLSTPILAGDEMLGLAAADILVSSLERKVLPVLARLGRPVVLANADGRVIVSNSPHWAPGQRLPHSSAAQQGPTASWIASWLLVDVDA